MDPVDVPLPGSPVAQAVPNATIAGSTTPFSHPVFGQSPRGSFFTGCGRVATAIFDLLVPAPVQQGWMIFLAFVHNEFMACSAPYRCGFFALIISIVVAEWQLPGCCLPRPLHVINAIIGFSCATLFVLGLFATSDFLETHKWPWQENGWVWPWQAWLWEGTVYDLGASTSTRADESSSPMAVTIPSYTFLGRPRSKSDTSTTTSTIDTSRNSSNHTPLSKPRGFDFSMPPPTAFKRPIIIPPTPQLPGGLRPANLLPPTPTEIHKSGILGESPMPLKFKHFSEDGFEKRKADLQAIAQWHRSKGTPLHLTAHNTVPEKRECEDIDEVNSTKKQRSFEALGLTEDTGMPLRRPIKPRLSADDLDLEHDDEKLY
ncbi:hypothetical protein DE146DRAFT_766376 [Phaeosphaeria sp. MPI-PUGE-AT-0046c]|nr:hypothetical protein DE146DRAFT_766376 [Phaeosphaeria sp. MPI-PUGE-AT-0046c]